MATCKGVTATKTTNTTTNTTTTSSLSEKDFTISDEKRWEGMSIEELEALSQHNQNILFGYEDSVKKVKNCQTKITDILKKKRHSIIMDKIDAITPEQQFDMLDKIPHSKKCQKLYSDQRFDTYTGFYVDRNHFPETPIVECPHCALKYVLNNSWLGIDFFPSVDFDFTEYDGGL